MKPKDLTFLKLKTKNWEAEFERIATTLCNECILMANEHQFAIVDVEFYYFSEQEHPDPFVYSVSDKNKLMGEWFFHYSGIDITFGCGETRGGILIRAIKKVNPPEYIIGTLKSMYAILTCFPSINSGEGLSLSLNQNPNPKTERLEKKIRIGLDKDKKKKDVDRYQDKEYRFIANYYEISEQIRNKTIIVDSKMKKNYGT